MKIRITEGPQKGKVFDMSGRTEAVIGRETDCDISIRDEGSSRHHARLVRDGDTLFIEDLGSTNGTKVNGHNVIKRSLGPSDQVRIGATVFELAYPDVEQRVGRTSVNLDSSHPSVEISIHHEQADLLANRTADAARDALEDERKVLREVSEIVHLIATEDDSESMLKSTLHRMQQILRADVACILLRDADNTNWMVRAVAVPSGIVDSITVSRSIVEAAVLEGVAILCQDTMDDVRFDPGKSIVMYGISSALCAPLKIEGRFCGALLLDRRGSAESFSPLDLRFAATVGNMLSVFLEKERLEAEARERERLAVIGEVMAGLAHYAKNILMGMKFSTATLKKVLEKKEYESAHGFLQSIEAQQERISGLVLDMLSYAKDRKPDRTEVALAGVLDAVTTPFQRHLQEQKIELKLEVAPGTPNVHAEETSMHRVFLNLLGNAIDAVTSAPEGNPKRVEISISPATDGAVVCFRDTGCGISTDQLARIFEVFYSTKGSKGTGLGLAVVKKLIEEHGGKIEVDSREGEWTEFRVTLPVGE
ncbi:MAG: ATP-binding protein [Verrucomicrobia bacterium]|nr:ATP-binding protein [Verrucomicrobiota bacterium]